MTGPSLRRARPLSPAERLYEQGTFLAVQGQLAAAEPILRQAVALQPGYVEALNNLGNVLFTQQRAAEALEVFRQAFAHCADDARIHYNIASSLRSLGEHPGGMRHLERAIALAPGYTDAYNNLGNSHSDLGDQESAVRPYIRALRLDPGSRRTHENLGRALYLLHSGGAVDMAARTAGEWLDEHPDNPLARHLGGAMAGRHEDARCSDDYVRDTFDQFAAVFEQTLLRIGYRGPELLAAAVTAAGVAPGADVLDAGCGTGLAGPLLRPLAARLVGVDLSSGMLAHAYGRGLYDELHEAELGAFLTARTDAFDLIVAADVLCYFGALDAVLAAAAGALKPGGLLAFTVERLDGEGDYRVNPHGRYAHAEDYVRRAVRGAGLDLRGLAAETLREECSKPVTGFVVTAVRT